MFSHYSVYCILDRPGKCVQDTDVDCWLQYSAAVGAFGSLGGEDPGECPAPARTDCAGAVSNCWSPGQRDTGESRY